MTFYASFVDMTYAAAKLSELSGDEKPRVWARRLMARYIDSADPNTGLPPWMHTKRRWPYVGKESKDGPILKCVRECVRR